MLDRFQKIRQEAKNRFYRYGEPVLAIGSYAIAEPVSGLAGIGSLLSGKSASDAALAIAQAQAAMTYQPRTAQGLQGLQGFQQAMQPIGEVIQGASQNLGDKAYSATRSPLVGAIGYSLPTAMMEGLGLKGLSIAKKPVSGADLYSARMGAGSVDEIDPITSAVYSNRKTFFDKNGDFDLGAYRSAEFDAEDSIDADAFDVWQNTDWEEASKARISNDDAKKLTNKVKDATLFHGSPYDFDDINVPDDGGAFLTGAKEAAEHYADGGNIYEYKIAPKKPFFVRSTDATYDIEQSDELRKLKSKGYDSIIPIDGGDYVILNKDILKKVK